MQNCNLKWKWKTYIWKATLYFVKEPEQEQEDRETADNISIAIQTADLSNDDAADATIIDPDASFNASSLYHGAWPLSPLKKGKDI